MSVPFGAELWDTCTVCNGSMWWMWGGEFWLHRSLSDEEFHLGVPAVYTEFTDRT